MVDETDSTDRPLSKKEQMGAQASELAASVIGKNQTLRAFFEQAVGRLHIISERTLDGIPQAKEKWEEGLDRFPDEAQQPAISALLETFIAQISSTLLGSEVESGEEST
jgi:hypothetical protein